MPTVHIIVGYAHNRIIGRGNIIPWRIRNDLVHLKELTQDQVVILGRKTYESMAKYYDKSGRPMPAKQYIIVTRNAVYKPTRSNAVAATSLEEAMQIASASKDVYVIGGMQIYLLALPYAEELHVTEIDATVDGDASFPEIDPGVFSEVSREFFPHDERNEYDHNFVVYKKL